MTNFDEVSIRPSKHIIISWMRKWNWDIADLRNALKQAYNIDKVGKNKYEAYTTYKSKNKSKKLIFVICDNELFVITGAEGKEVLR